jgi:bleomycin hydrolase
MQIRNLILGFAAAAAMGMSAQTIGALDQATLNRLAQSYKPTAAERAIHNALNTADINTLAASADARNSLNDEFAYRVPSKGITNQERSGRCWLFTGLNVLRAQAIREHNLSELKLSQAYDFFYDQLEKSNMFLQVVIDTAKKPMDDRTVDWLFHNPLSDGGQFTGVSDIISKYGVVPATVMPETYSSNHTATFSKLLGWKLKEWGLELRDMVKNGSKTAALQSRKEEMLNDVYKILAMNFGVPPTQFTYKGKAYTPMTFYNELFGNDLKNNYVMFMNDPTRPYYKLYEIDLDRHAYDGENWRYVNVPIEEIKKMAIESIKDSTAMYFSCDVNKFMNRDNGTLNLDNYDYAAIMGVEFNMTKAQRIATRASGSTHAMTLVGVDLDNDGNATKWLIENSWGNSANEGHLIATDKWMDEYLFRLVVERRFVPEKLLNILNEKPTVLPCWDPMF